MYTPVSQACRQKIVDLNKCINKLDGAGSNPQIKDMRVCIDGDLEDVEELKSKLNKVIRHKKAVCLELHESLFFWTILRCRLPVHGLYIDCTLNSLRHLCIINRLPHALT